METKGGGGGYSLLLSPKYVKRTAAEKSETRAISYFYQRTSMAISSEAICVATMAPVPD